MKLRKLSSGIKGAILLCTVVFFGMACNNSDKSGNTSTTEVDSNAMNNTTVTNTGNDSTGTNSTTTNPANTVKKKGKISFAVPPVDKSAKMEADNMGYYNYTETAPAFRGGQSSLESYITNNIEYPQEAIDNNVEGTINIQFTIDENGKVGNAKLSSAKLGYGLEEAAIKVVNDMPKWTPGTVKGKSVKAWYTLPLTFRLEG